LTNFSALWLCLTPVVWIVSGAAIVNEKKGDYAESALVSMIVFVPIWWAIYFLIRTVIR